MKPISWNFGIHFVRLKLLRFVGTGSAFEENHELLAHFKPRSSSEQHRSRHVKLRLSVYLAIRQSFNKP